jgi:dTDP-4-amino-4,6-dideoxygalactose transaminase
VDAAEALGARYLTKKLALGYSKGRKDASDVRPLTSDLWHHAGAGATAAVFSFNGNKIITTSGGGMLVSDDKDLIEKARSLSQQARDPAPHYEHTQFGYNYRMSNILAAIGRGQLRILDDRVKKRRRIFDYYRGALSGIPGIEFMPETPYGKSNRWLTVILITPEEFGADRETVRLELEEENIEARPVWKPMHLQPVFHIQAQSSKLKARNNPKSGYPARAVGGEVAEDLFNRGLCLPSGTAMTEADLDRIIKTIKRCKR